MYYLMNKDEKIASFEVDPLLEIISIVEQYRKLPQMFGDIDNFVANRRAPKGRENIKKLLRASGCNTLQGFLDISHALSLVDTFWVKPTDSKLTWSDFSLYKHAFNENIATAALTGELNGDLSTTSPEYETDGSFAKCWIRENDQIKMLKRGSSGASNAGLEPYSEFYSSEVASHFTDNFVKYGLRSREGRICSVCDIFTSEEFGFIPYAALDSSNAATINPILKKAEELGFLDEIKTMFVLDAVIMNADRHKNNFGFIMNNDTFELVGFAPLFDHNLALLPYAVEESEFEFKGEYYDQHGPKIGDNWVPIATACLTPKTRKVLINLKGFEFTRHEKLNLPEWRLKALEKIMQKTIDAILELDAMYTRPVFTKVDAFK